VLLAHALQPLAGVERDAADGPHAAAQRGASRARQQQRRARALAAAGHHSRAPRHILIFYAEGLRNSLTYCQKLRRNDLNFTKSHEIWKYVFGMYSHKK
jgi:hypothetical protein